MLVPLVAAPALILTLSGAASAAPSSIGVSYTTDVLAAAKPNSNIGGAPVHFTPSTIVAKRSGNSGTTCTAAKVAFTLTNTTAKLRR